jgi:hypothetical protein
MRKLSIKRLIFTKYKIVTRDKFLWCMFHDDNCMLYYDKYIVGKLFGVVWFPVKNYLVQTEFKKDDK